MIVSITCRHGTESDIDRNAIHRELMGIRKYNATITRCQLIFSQETHYRQGDNLVTCHLSIHLPGRHHIDIYEQRPSLTQGFERAKDRAIQQLIRLHVTKSCSRQARVGLQ